MKTTITTLFAASILLFACNHSTNEHSKEGVETTTHEEGEHHHHEHQNEALALNNGEKWEADDNTRTYVQEMQRDVNTFEAKSADDYAALAKKLKSNIDLLTAGCTMKGEAHEELHKWLLPFIELTNEFSDNKTEQESAAYLEKIKTSFTSFNTYFK